MIRTTTLEVDNSSWPKGVPFAISSLAGKHSFDLRKGLLHTAFRTRPPYIHGFHLSDSWVWPRYGHAFQESEKLCLRSEWTDLDPHQKTILSDDLGMGLTTQFLEEKLGIKHFHNTLHYMKVVAPRALKFLRVAKNGAAKSPDFICFDSKNRITLLECKGSQSTQAALRKAMETGKKQKANVVGKTGRVYQALVMGLFVPQFGSKDQCILRIADPNWAEVNKILSELSEEELAIADTRLELARTFAFLGYGHSANLLSSTRFDAKAVLTDKARQELSDAIVDEEEMIQIESPVSRSEPFFEETGVAQFTRIRYPKKHIASFLEAGSLDKAVLRERESSTNRVWGYEANEREATLTSPTGLELSLWGGNA